MTHPTRYIFSTARTKLKTSAVLATLVMETLDNLITGNTRLTHITCYSLLCKLKRKHIYSIHSKLHNGTDTVPEKGLSMSWKIKGFLATFRCEKCKVGPKIRWCIIKKFIFRQGDKNCKYCHIVGRWEPYGSKNGRGFSKNIIHKYCTACGSYLRVLLPRH